MFRTRPVLNKQYRTGTLLDYLRTVWLYEDYTVDPDFGVQKIRHTFFKKNVRVQKQRQSKGADFTGNVQ